MNKRRIFTLIVVIITILLASCATSHNCAKEEYKSFQNRDKTVYENDHIKNF